MSDKKDPKTSPWPARLRRSRKYQEDNSEDWKRNAALLYGKNPDQGMENDVAYAWGLVKGLETAIYVQNPDMALEAYDEGQRPVADLITSIVNYDADMMNLKEIGNLGLVDNFICGYAAFIETMEVDKDTVRYPDAGKEEERTRLKAQDYAGKRIPYWDIYFDPKGLHLDLSDHDYVCVAFYPTIGALKDDPVFKKNLPTDIDDYPEINQFNRQQRGKRPYMGGTGRPTPEKDPDYKTICVWEIHDKIGQEIVYLTDHKEREIGRIPWPVKFEVGPRKLFPITLMAFHPSPLGFYPKPVISLIANQLIALNKIDRMIIRDVTTKWRKYVTFGNLFTPDEAAKITDPTVENALMIADTDNLDELAGTGGQVGYPNVNELIGALKDPAPKQDYFIGRDMILQEINDILGYGSSQRGGLPKTRSAREAMAVKERQDQRLNKLADAVADMYRGFFQKHIIFLQNTMEVSRYARVVKEAQNLTEWVNYAKQDIQGQFHFKVFSGSSMPRNTEAKRAMALQEFQAVAPVLQAAGLPLEPAFLRFAQVMQWQGVEALFKNYKQIAKSVVVDLGNFQKQQISPAQFLEKVAALVQAVLTPQEIQMVNQQAGAMAGAAVSPATSVGMRGDASPLKTATGTM